MTRRNRTLRLIAMLVVLAGTLVSLVAPAIPVQAQDDGDPAARPPEFPIEILFDEQYFLFDREIPIATEGLVEVGQQEDLTFYAETAEGPHDRLFVSSALATETLARYLPEIPVGDDGTSSGECLPRPTTRIWRSPKRGGCLRLRRVGAGRSPRRSRLDCLDRRGIHRLRRRDAATASRPSDGYRFRCGPLRSAGRRGSTAGPR